MEGGRTGRESVNAERERDRGSAVRGIVAGTQTHWCISGSCHWPRWPLMQRPMGPRGHDRYANVTAQSKSVTDRQHKERATHTHRTV